MTTTADDVVDEDRLPWLESAEDEYREGPSAARVIGLIVAGLLVIAGVVFGVNWLRDRGPAAGTGALIAAPQGDYKVKPDDPGGMKVDGEGDSVFATSEGTSGNSSVEANAVPEAPVKGKTAPNEAPKGKAESRVVAAIPASGGALTAQAPAIATPRSAQAGGGGSFPSEASANAAWGMFSKRFTYLAPLGK